MQPVLTVAILLGAPLAWAAEPPPSAIRSDEQVILFPAAARLSEDGMHWETRIRGWVYESESGDLLRNRFLAELRDALRIEPDSRRDQIMRQRLSWFLVDNERGKRVGLRIGQRTHIMPPSDVAGHLDDLITLPADEAASLARGGRIEVEVVLPADDARRIIGTIHLIAPQGLSVISDIDDTIKISNVLDRVALLDNTFCRPFQAVDGMAGLYQRWAADGAAFHYVSSSPWQLYEPLAQFARDAGFPEGVFHMKKVRLKDRSILRLFDDPFDTKPPVIRELLERYPHRRFILVGDSGEKDPEVYGAIARQFPEQVMAIYIRDVTGEDASAQRYRAAFRDTAPETWRVFQSASELRELR